MSLGDAAEAFGPVLTMIGSLAMLGRQMLSSPPGLLSPLRPRKTPIKSEDASVMVVVHVHLPCEGCRCHRGGPRR